MKKYLFILVFSILCLVKGNAQSVAQTRCDNFHKGVNLANWLEGYWETHWPDTATYNYAFLAEMKRAGIESVRMPVCFALVTDTVAPYTVDTNNKVFSLVDSVISWTSALNMKLIIDNHHQWNITDTTWRPELPRLAHLWAVLAKRYQHLDPDKYFFEILNEPSYISNDTLAVLYPPVIDSIRKYAPFHSIIVSPNEWSNGLGYNAYQPLNTDTNLIYTFHSYDPFTFTHQGLSFVVPPLPTGVTYPDLTIDFLITFNWETMLLWRDSFQLPVCVGEFGVGIGADAQSRCNWMDTIGRLIDSNHLSAFYWDVEGDFRWYNSGVPTYDSLNPCFQHPLHLYGDTGTLAVTYTAAEIPVNIYPNPACDAFKVDIPLYSEALLQVYDEVGRHMFETGFINQYIINCANYSAGVYFVKVKTASGQVVRKIIIE